MRNTNSSLLILWAYHYAIGHYIELLQIIADYKSANSNIKIFAIVPLLEGSGTRLKILEAMSFGLPVISTSIGAEGIDYIENKHIIIANDGALFQKAIIDTVNKPSILKNLASESLLLINEKYNWQTLVKKMVLTFD